MLRCLVLWQLVRDFDISKKLQFIQSVKGNTSKTAKTLKM